MNSRAMIRGLDSQAEFHLLPSGAFTASSVRPASTAEEWPIRLVTGERFALVGVDMEWLSISIDGLAIDRFETEGLATDTAAVFAMLLGVSIATSCLDPCSMVERRLSY